MLDLARRAVACAAWKWRSGMLAWEPEDEHGGRGGHRVTAPGAPMVGWLPGFDDDATLGCFLALVLEAHGTDPARDPWECGEHPDGGGFVTLGDRTWTGTGLAAALVAALEAAPDAG